MDSTLVALASIYRLYLKDSLIREVPWRFYMHPLREQPGLLYAIPVYDLPRGEYVLRLEQQRIRRDSLCWGDVGVVSFLR